VLPNRAETFCSSQSAPDHDTDPKELHNLANDRAQALTVEELSTKLRAPAKGTFPPSGKTPELKPELWAPNLTEP
jgi:iduronate 2-sulfatase